MNAKKAPMGGLTRIVIVLLSLFFLGVSACQKEEEGPAEKAGETIDRVLEKAGEKIEESGEEVQEAAE